MPRLLFLVATVAVTLMIASSVTTDAAVPPPLLVILSAEPDFQSSVITISGENFGATPPTVVLGDQLLTVLVSTNTAIVAALPPMPPGTYQLLVSAGPATTQNNTLDVTPITPL